MTEAELAQFPNMTLAVTNVPLVMQPQRYLLQGYALHSKPSEYCLAVTKTGPGGLQILGRKKKMTITVSETMFRKALAGLVQRLTHNRHLFFFFFSFVLRR